MPQFLEDLSIEEISLVSKDWAPGPANKHARILFSKTAKERESEMPNRMDEILAAEEITKTGNQQPDQESAQGLIEELAGEIRKMAEARGADMSVEKSIALALEKVPHLYAASCSR